MLIMVKNAHVSKSTQKEKEIPFGSQQIYLLLPKLVLLLILHKNFSAQKIDGFTKIIAPKLFTKSCMVDQSSYYKPTKFNVKQVRIVDFLEGKANALPVHCS